VGLLVGWVCVGAVLSTFGGLVRAIRGVMVVGSIAKLWVDFRLLSASWQFAGSDFGKLLFY
jgi:hypothetical protein